MECRFVDRVIVSTDDAAIGEVARNLGAETPFVRPPELSDDYCATLPVLQHAIQWVEKHWGGLSHVLTLCATAPFIQSSLLSDAFEALQNHPDKVYAFGVGRFSSPIQRAFKKTSQNGVEMFTPEFFESRSQDLEPAYFDAGQFYWGTKEAFLDGLNMFEDHSLPIEIAPHRVQDIDTIDDWIRAEALFKVIQSDQQSGT